MGKLETGEEKKLARRVRSNLKQILMGGSSKRFSETLTPLFSGLPHPDFGKEHYTPLLAHLGGQYDLETVGEAIDALSIYSDPDKKGSNPAKVYSFLSEAIKNMNRLFEKSIDLPPTKDPILCGSTSNIDRISYLRDNETATQKINKALEAAQIEGKEFGKSEQQVIEEIEKIIYAKPEKLENIARTKVDVIGFILRMFKGDGGRVIIGDLDGQPGSGKNLGEWIGETFGIDIVKVGGAAAQLTDFLAGIGEENVVLYTQFNNTEQAKVYKNSPNFLRFGPEDFIIGDVQQSAVETDPIRICYPIERVANLSVEFNGKTIKSTNESDRVIFLDTWYDQGGKVADINPLLSSSPQVLEKIGRKFKYYFDTSLNYLQRFSKEKYDLIVPEKVKELQILRKYGTKILYEFSGRTTDVKYFRDVLQNNIDSISINHDKELLKVVKSIKAELEPDLEVIDDNSPYAIYKNAVSLAKYLGVERLHVHGHEVDIVLRKTATKEGLETEVGALMFSKQRVTEWLQGKISKEVTPDNERPSRLLKREGYRDFLQFIGDFAKGSSFEDHFGGDLSGKNLFKARAKLIQSFIKNGYYKEESGYSVVVTPVKWVYNETKVTTSSGDVSALVDAIHSGL